ncbi:HMG-box, partial [Armillaria gallica]
DELHIPRPSNAYIIFRSEFVALNKESLSKTQKMASKLAGAAWRRLPKEIQDHYKGLAKERKEEHARAYPGYKYKPRRSKRGK